jgi:hypothetical protein
MKQESLDFGRLYRVDDGARGVYRALNDAVDQLGILVVAGACGVDRADMRRSLDRQGRRVAIEHAMAIAAISQRDAREQIITTFAEPLGHALAEQRPALTDRERADRMEMVLRSIGGALGHAAADRVLRGER